MEYEQEELLREQALFEEDLPPGDDATHEDPDLATDGDAEEDAGKRMAVSGENRRWSSIYSAPVKRDPAKKNSIKKVECLNRHIYNVVLDILKVHQLFVQYPPLMTLLEHKQK